MTLPPINTFLPHHLATRWRLGCIFLSISFFLTILSHLASSPALFDFLAPSPTGPFLVYFSIWAFAWSFLQHAFWPVSIWLITDFSGDSLRNFARGTIRILAIGNSALIIFYLIACLLFVRDANWFKITHIGWPIFLLAYILRTLTYLLTALWLASLADRLAHTLLARQFALLAILLPISHAISFLGHFAFESVMPSSIAYATINLSIALSCLLLAWFITLLLLFARTLSTLPTSHTPAFELTSN